MSVLRVALWYNLHVLTGCGHPDYPGIYAKVSNPDILNWVDGFVMKCSYKSVLACGTISKELTEMGKQK